MESKRLDRFAPRRTCEVRFLITWRMRRQSQSSLKSFDSNCVTPTRLEIVLRVAISLRPMKGEVCRFIMNTFRFFLMASLAGCAVSVLPINERSGMRKLDGLEERQHVGAGIFKMQCFAVSGYNCVNNLVLGGSCQPGYDGVQCSSALTPQECQSSWSIGWFDDCSSTMSVQCPNGIIMKCPNGVWVDKRVGNGACGTYRACL